MLNRINGLKMIKFSSSSQENEIHMVNSPIKRGSQKYNFFQEGPNFGEERPENLKKIGNNMDIYCYANRGVFNFEREYQSLPPGTITPRDASTFLHATPNFREKKMKKTQFSGQNLTFL